MFVYRVIYYIVFISSFILLIQTDEHLNAIGPFGKLHIIGSEPKTHVSNRGAGISPPFSPPKTKTVQNIRMRVSKMLYVSNEQIQLTWIPISFSCKYDFIGIYSPDIPIGKGKYASSL